MSCPRALKNVTRTAGNWTTNLLISRTAPPLSYSHPHRIHTWQLCEQICYCSSSIIVFFIHMCMSFLGLDYELFSKAVVLCIYCSLLFWSGYVVHYEGWSCGCAYGYCSIAPFVVQDVDTLWKTLAMKELLSRISNCSFYQIYCMTVVEDILHDSSEVKTNKHGIVSKKHKTEYKLT